MRLSCSLLAKPMVALVAGAGDSTGAAICRRFAREGFTTCAVRRNGDKLKPLVAEIRQSGGQAIGFGLDFRNETDVVELITKIEHDIGSIEVAVFNIGANVKYDVCDTTARVYYKVWEMAAFGAFLFGRECARVMQPRGRGTIVFTGATASVRGSSGFCAFAGAKHAKRALAQSMARELGPKGIHVCHVVVDGAIDTPFVHQLLPDFASAAAKNEGLLKPEAIADVYWQLHQQKKHAWTHEMDLRPWVENW